MRHLLFIALSMPYWLHAQSEFGTDIIIIGNMDAVQSATATGEFDRGAYGKLKVGVNDPKDDYFLFVPEDDGISYMGPVREADMQRVRSALVKGLEWIEKAKAEKIYGIKPVETFVREVPKEINLNGKVGLEVIFLYEEFDPRGPFLLLSLLSPRNDYASGFTRLTVDQVEALIAWIDDLPKTLQALDDYNKKLDSLN